MSEESQIFLEEIQVLIFDAVTCAGNMLSGREKSANDYLGGNLNVDDITILKSIPFSDEQKKALMKLLLAVGRLSVTGVLSVIDGVIMSENHELPELSLINRNTGENITDDFLNEEFYKYIPDNK